MIKIDNIAKQRLLDIPIESVASALGIKVLRHHALCFMHDDHHPSLAFFPSKNRWKCFVCDVWGDNISLVMRYNNQNFTEACIWLSNAFGIDVKGIPQVAATVRERPEPKQVAEEKVTPDLEVLEFIVDNLSLTDKARQFLFDERHYSEEVVSKLHICAISYDRFFVRFLVRRFGEERILKSQLAYKTEKGLVSYFHGPCLFFPYYDHEGRLVGLQSRYMGSYERHQRFQFPKGSESHIFNLNILSDMHPDEPLYISEGVTDAIALLSSGKKAIAIPSATLLRPHQLRHIIDHPLFMYPDHDEPGERLFVQIQKAVEDLGGQITRMSLAHGMKDFSEQYRHEIEETMAKQP